MVYKSIIFQWTIVILVFKQGESCEEDWIQNSGNCYKIFTERNDKASAETICLEHRSALASVSNVEENTFLVTQLSKANTSEENYWVGLHKIDNELLWNNRLSAGNLPWVDVSSVPGSSDCFIFNSAKVLPRDCSTAAGFICEKWKTSENRPATCPPGAHGDTISEKCFWYTHMPLSKAGSEVLCSLKYGGLLEPRGLLFPVNILMILAFSPPPPPVILWTSLVVKNGSFLFEDGTEFAEHGFTLRLGVGDCVALALSKESSPYEMQQKSCLEEALGFCESNMDFIAGDFWSKFEAMNTNVPSVPLEASCPVGPNWQEHDETGFCYWETAYETNRISWEDARKYCQSYGGDLASFHSIQEEQIGLGFQFGSTEHPYWIGVYFDIDNDRYVWSDGTPLDYTNWDEGQPNHVDRRMRCGYMSSIKKKWSLNYCGMLNWFICKAPKQINPPPPVIPTAEPILKCSEDSSEYFFEGYCYEKFSQLLGWHRAQQYCENRGRNLVSIHSEKEVDFIIRMLATSGTQGNRMWIGLNSLGFSGAFKWTDGSVVDFTNWDNGEPNNFQNQEKCVNMYAQHGMWNDENCNAVLNFLCKRKNDTNRGVITTTTEAPIKGNCPKDWLMFEGKCFLPIGARATQRKNWTEAGLHCLSLGGYLASIRNARDQAFMFYLMQNLKMDTWIGLHDSIHSGVFFWTDSSPLFYANWAQGEPSSFGFQEDCVIISYGKTNGGRWKDTQCDRQLPYICQTLPDPSLTIPSPVRGTRCPHVPSYMKQGLSCYKMFTTPASWEEAKVTCSKDGGYLVSIYDMETEAVVNYLAALSLKKNDSFWVGLQSDGSYPLKWENGWPMSFSRWGRNEPKGFIGQKTCFYDTFSGSWLSASCSEKKSFICHINAEEAPKPRLPVKGECPSGSKSKWIEVGNSCFFFGLRWAVEQYTANFRCFIEGANLVSFHSMDMLNKLQPYLKDFTKNSVFIGLIKNSDGGFEWTDKTAVDFVNWDQDEPQESDFQCADMRLDTMKWRVADCDLRKHYICAKDKENSVNPTSDTLKSSSENTLQKNEQQVGLFPGAIAAIVISIIILAVALVVVLIRRRPWEKEQNRYRVHSPEPITSFENAICGEDTNTIDFHDKNVLFVRD